MFTTMEYNKPFLITYLCTSTFTLYLARPLYSYLRWRNSGREIAVTGPYQTSGVKSTETLEYVTISASTATPRLMCAPCDSTLFEPVGSYHDENGVLLIRPDVSGLPSFDDADQSIHISSDAIVQLPHKISLPIDISPSISSSFLDMQRPSANDIANCCASSCIHRIMVRSLVSRSDVYASYYLSQLCSQFTPRVT